MHYDLRKRLRLRENTEKGKDGYWQNNRTVGKRMSNTTLKYDVYTGHETVNIFRQMSVQVEKTVWYNPSSSLSFFL